MRRVRPETRGTTLAKSLRRVRKAFAGSLRLRAGRTEFDKRIFTGEARRPLALPRGAAGRARRKHCLARGRLDASAACAEVGGAARLEAPAHQGRIAEPDAELQG